MGFCEFTRHDLLLMPMLAKNVPNLNLPKTGYLHFTADTLQPALLCPAADSQILFRDWVLCPQSFNLALLFCLSFTIHIGSDEDLWRGVLDLTAISQIKAMESSGLSRTRNPADLRGSGSQMCLQALGTAAN